MTEREDVGAAIEYFRKWQRYEKGNYNDKFFTNFETLFHAAKKADALEKALEEIFHHAKSIGIARTIAAKILAQRGKARE